MPHKSIEPEDREVEVQNNDGVFETEDLRHPLIQLFRGDLYIIGKLWIEALKAVLVGAKLCLIPVVNAAPPPSPPEKPPPMKYTDLPLYKAPHYEYNDYMTNKDKCPKANVKLMQEYLLPHVKSYRKSIQQSYREVSTDLQSGKKEICDAINAKKKKFIKYMRDPENLQTRQGVVLMGSALGYYMGGGRGIPRRLFFTSVGILSTGALCFPDETDENFRNFASCSAKCAINLYNRICGKHFSMRERLPCKDDLPPAPKPRKANQCPPK